MKKNRLILLDILRIVAISLVVGTHILQKVALFSHAPWVKFLTQYFGIKDFYWVSMGGLGITLFLILSGMVLEYNYGQTNIKYFSFIFKRFKRIYLTYWLCLILALPLLASVDSYSFGNLIYNFSSLMIYDGQPWKQYLIPTAWFLGLILYLYLFFPILSKTLKKRPGLTLITILLISIVSRWYMGQTNLWYRGIDSFPLSRLFEFGLGIWLIQRPKVQTLIIGMSQKLKGEYFSFLSELAFPAFLVHSVFLKLNIISAKAPFLSIVKFLELTLIFSFVIYILEKRLGHYLCRNSPRS